MNSVTNLNRLQDESALIAALKKHGISEDGAARKARRFTHAANVLAAQGIDPAAETLAIFVPGRIEVLGKHTDYAGGRSLLCATEHGFSLIAVPRDDAKIRIRALDLDDVAEFDLDANLTPKVGHWSNYPMTVARRIARNFDKPLIGAEIAFTSDLPGASGMSSSSALMIAIFQAISLINDLPARSQYKKNIQDRETLAEYLGTVENGQTFRDLPGDKGVGTFGGSQDHTAILCCKANQLSQYAFCPVRHERDVAIPDGYAFAIASSGVIAEKTGQAMEKYNRASLRARAVAEIWRDATDRDDPHMGAALSSDDPQDVAQKMQKILSETSHPDFSNEELLSRFEQFYAESMQIIPQAGDALAACDVENFGKLVDRSQELTTHQLGNQIPETVQLASTARMSGAVAASAFGAGFGGSVWALIRKSDAETFLENWRRGYGSEFPEPAKRASMFITEAGPSAMTIQL